MSTTTRKAMIAGGFIVAVIAAATGIEAIRQGHAAPTSMAAPSQVTQPLSKTTTPIAGDIGAALSQAFRGAAQRALPAVVSVQVESTQRVAQFRGLPFFDQPQGREELRPVQGFGSGFVFRADGYILTNNHVIDEAQRVTVRFQDGRQMSATVVGRDPNTDVAVVKVDATGLQTVEFADSDQSDVGDWVVALGYPLQLGNTATVTAGIVSAIGRNINILTRNQEANAALEYFIQTDAAINPGNSGGPLIDLNGRVIGVNSAIASPTGYYSGYGFAIPINIAKRVSDDLIKYGEYRRPRLGVGVRDVAEPDKEVHKLAGLEGALVSQVQEGTAAEKAGVQLGDVILAVDGQKLNNSGELIELLGKKYEPGQKVALDIIRYGQRMKIDVTLSAFEPAVRAGRTAAEPPARGVAKLGFSAVELTPQIARQLGFEADRGVAVTEVDPTGSARGYLAPGTVIERVNGRDIRSLADLERVADGIKPGEVVSLVIRTRAGRSLLNYRIRD